MAGRIVPFGKYRGRPAEELAVDRDYCDWLMAQPWFVDRYRDVYNLVINYGGEPQDSPEHNKLQALLLDDDFCIALAKAAGEKLVEPTVLLEKKGAEFREEFERKRQFGEAGFDHLKVENKCFEHFGWDCIFRIEASYWWWVYAGRNFFKEGRWVIENIRSHTDRCHSTSIAIGVECKPIIADDYPAVLRQVKGFNSPGRRVVLASDFAGTTVALDDVRRIYESSGVKLLILDQVLSVHG